jgi:hypothetical protein
MQNEYNARGKLIHEPRAADGERLDAYLARVLPKIGGPGFWLAACEANRVQVRDHWNPQNGSYDGSRWFVRWWDGRRWSERDLETGERPRMRNGYCHIVKEGTA